jgi:hypothetical protein
LKLTYAITLAKLSRLVVDGAFHRGRLSWMPGKRNAGTTLLAGEVPIAVGDDSGMRVGLTPAFFLGVFVISCFGGGSSTTMRSKRTGQSFQTWPPSPGCALLVLKKVPFFGREEKKIVLLLVRALSCRAMDETASPFRSQS